MWTVCGWQFTRREYGAPIPPGKEATFEYMFRPDPKLDANEYPLSADVVYMGKRKPFRTFFFNQTIELMEKSAIPFVSGKFLQTLMLVAVIVVAFAYFSQYFGHKGSWKALVRLGNSAAGAAAAATSQASARPAASVETGTRTDGAPAAEGDGFVVQKYAKQDKVKAKKH